MKAIFLDVDGVLNNEKWATQMWKTEHISVYRENILYAPSLVLLSRLVKDTDARVVLSSSWRKIPKARKALETELKYHGISIYSETPVLSGIRGDEIDAWLFEHQDVKQYVILDDDSDMGKHLPCLVQTDYNVGLRMHDYDLAKAILLKDQLGKVNPL